MARAMSAAFIIVLLMLSATNTPCTPLSPAFLIPLASLVYNRCNEHENDVFEHKHLLN